MPPHCDTLDGPVVKSARLALENNNINIVLPWAPKETETEIKNAFKKTIAARKLGKDAKEIADYWFFETAVRLHRVGEGAPYTGLKPAGLDAGPIVPRAEKAIDTENPEELIDFLSNAVKDEINKKFNHAIELKNYKVNDVDSAREYIEAMLDFILYSHHLYEYVKSGGYHAEKEATGHGH